MPVGNASCLDVARQTCSGDFHKELFFMRVSGRRSLAGFAVAEAVIHGRSDTKTGTFS